MTIPTRRRFLSTSAAASAALAFPSILRGAENTTQLKIGLVGCGGRGTGAAQQALSADPNVTLHALADAFPEPLPRTLGALKKFGDRSSVPPERQFHGLDAFEKLLASGIDVVLLATPPAFRPQHLRAAIKAGVHVFSEKPMAVDVAGVKSVMESAKLAKENNIAIQHGYCWRFAPGVRELYQKILDGEIGRVTSVYGTYLSGPPKPLDPKATKPKDMSDVEWQLRWWINFEWLSGGPLLEQAIHTVDKIAWVMNDIAPVAAVGSGGRAWKTDAGNTYDHYNIAYEYPGNVFCQLGQRQYLNCFSETTDRVFGEKGTAVAPNTPMILGPDGKKRTWMARPQPGQEQNMYQVCHNELFAALRRGEIINTGEYMANSTMLGLLGREAAHSGKRVTWEQMWNGSHDLAPDDLKMSDSFPVTPAPIPGIYQNS